MSIDTVFKPIGQLTFVGVTPVRVVPNDGSGICSYRVVNLSVATTEQYFGWGVTASAATAALVNTPVTAPGNVAPNVIGMLGASVETFEIPAGVFFAASSATGFQFLAGQGA
jgi:hypothetical protein